MDTTSEHYKGKFTNIYAVHKKFPGGGSEGDYVDIGGFAHYWNADRGTWCVNENRDAYWDDKFADFEQGIDTNTAAIEAEVVRAQNAEHSIDITERQEWDDDAKVQARDNIEAAKASDLSDEVTRAKAAEKVNEDAISAEVTRAKARENEINLAVQEIDLREDIQWTDDQKKKARENIEAAKASDLSDEVSRAQNVEHSIDITERQEWSDDAKVQARDNIEAAKASDLSDEVTRAKAAEETNASNISDLALKTSSISKGSESTLGNEVSIATDNGDVVVNVTDDGVNVNGTLKKNGVEVITDVSGKADQTSLDATNAKVTTIQEKITCIDKKTITDNDELISIKTDDDAEVIGINDNGVAVTGSLTKNGKEVNAFEQITSGLTSSSDEEEVFADDEETETFAKIGSYGIKSKAYLDLDGNPIAIETDTSLTKSGNAADSKVVGDRLNEKQNLLTSGANIKTINGESILGEGNLALSATSMKTINGEDITGSGNIEIEGTYVSPYLDRPTTGKHCFSVNVNIHRADLDTDAAIGDADVEGTDYGWIELPTNYTKSGTPTRLIIYCHGAGAELSTYKSETAHLEDHWTCWTKLGFAYMDMYACPNELSGDNSELHLGNPTVLECYKKGYDYVMKNFNLCRDGIFVIGSSMGGLSSFQIVQSGMFPVIAQVANCPCIDLYKQAYIGQWDNSNRQRISNYYGFEGTAPTFTTGRPGTEEERTWFKDNIEKWLGYSPIIAKVVSGNVSKSLDYVPSVDDSSSYTASENATEATYYNQMVAIHPCPLKIFHCKDDVTVMFRYSKYFVDMVRRSGGKAWLRPFTTGGHAAWAVGDTIQLTDIDGNSFTIHASTYEAYLFIKRYN